MAIIRYDNGETRDSATMCNHCSENCGCAPLKRYPNLRPGCGAGTCTCPPPSDPYPEHTKLNAISEQSQACGEFLAWLMCERGYVLSEYHKHTDDCEDGDPVCRLSTETLYPATLNTRALLAEFFEIDENRLEAEKRAMIASLSTSQTKGETSHG